MLHAIHAPKASQEDKLFHGQAPCTGHNIQPTWPFITLLWVAQERLLRIPLELPAGMQAAPALLLPLCVTRVFTALPTGALTADWLARH